MSETTLLVASNFVIGFLTIAAIIIGPIAALRIQARIENKREATNRKLQVFTTLMTYRATPLNPLFVQALNSIDVEFGSADKADKVVRDAWKELLDFFNTGVQKPNSFERGRELTAALLSAMSKCLGYDFDNVHLKNNAYYPTAHFNLEEELHDLRHKLLNLLDGKSRLPVGVFEQTFPPLAEPMNKALEPVPERKELTAGQN